MSEINNYTFESRDLEWFEKLIGVNCDIVVRRKGAISPMEYTRYRNPISNKTDAELYHRHYKANEMEAARSHIKEVI